MEVIFELLWWVAQFFAELIFEVALQLAADAFGHGARKKIRRSKPVDPMLAACGYLAAGWLVGMLSLWLMPEVFIKAQWLRVAGLVLLPLATASIMSLLGSWRARHDKQVGGLETFSYGFCFAFMVSLVRFIWGRVA